MNEKDILNKMRSERFTDNNGTVLRAVNIGRTNYNRLAQLRSALDTDIDSAEFADAVNYLYLAGYISLRKISSGQPANTADDPIDECEAKLTADGIRLLAGKISDECVRV